MLEVGRAQRTVFIARYLRDRDLQREINAGLNVVENYNGVNDYIFFGKPGELSTNRREEQEISMICLQILQSCLGYPLTELPVAVAQFTGQVIGALAMVPARDRRKQGRPGPGGAEGTAGGSAPRDRGRVGAVPAG
jgi:hypothetical protein